MKKLQNNPLSVHTEVTETVLEGVPKSLILRRFRESRLGVDSLCFCSKTPCFLVFFEVWTFAWGARGRWFKSSRPDFKKH